MNCHRVAASLCLFVLTLTVGCNEKMESVPDVPPPEKPPAVPPDASLRPLYQMEKGAPVAAGTAFIIEDRAGKRYMLTAAHIMDNEAEWNQAGGAALRVMGGPVVCRVQGRPVHIGRSFTDAGPTDDLVFWPLAEGSKVTPLKLAEADVKKNEWVWVIGQEPSSTGPQKLYRCQVKGAENGGLQLQQHDRFEMRGFSGGPIVNAQGEVVGSLLGGRDKSIIAMRVGAIRERLKEAKIELP